MILALTLPLVLAQAQPQPGPPDTAAAGPPLPVPEAPARPRRGASDRATPAPTPRPVEGAGLPPGALAPNGFSPAGFAAALRLMWAEDPPVEALRQAAAALALAEPARARSLVERARWAGWLPETRVRIDRRFGRNESEDFGKTPLDVPVTPVGVDTTNDVRYEWRASWDLSRIVFNPEEIGATSQALRVADIRREIESRVIHLFFERRRLKAEALASDASDTTSVIRRELHIQEIEAELDAVTGGAFTRLRTVRGGDPSFTAP